MDIVDFLSKQITKWNTEGKCGFCWQFGAPLVVSQVNIEQPEQDKDCCVNFFVTDISYRDGIIYNSAGMRTANTCDWTFTAYAVIRKNLGINNYTEIKGHEVDSSKWVTVYKPLADCLGCGSTFDFCDILGYEPRLLNRSASLVHNWLDDSYCGWKYTYTIRVDNDLLLKNG